MMARPNFRTPPVVMNLLAINVLVFLAYAILPDSVSRWMVQNFALFYPASPNFMPHQLVTYMFMHGGFGHILFNMFALWMFGRILEYSLGSKRFLIFYMVSGIGAALIQMGVTAIEVSVMTNKVAAGAASIDQLFLLQNVPTVGASGAIFGILLAFGMLYPNSVISLLFPPISMKAKYFVMLYGAVELFFGVSGWVSSVAHFAHLGGMLWGFLLLWYWKKKGKIYY